MNIKLLINNLRYLSRYNIKQLYLDSNDILEFIEFEQKLYENNSPLVFYPKIKTPEETIKELVDGNKSFVRFGYSEFTIIKKQDNPFQSYNQKLESRLRDILISQDENIAISIPYTYFNISNKNYTGILLEFIKNNVLKIRKTVLNTIDLNKTYYATEITQLYSIYTNYNFKEYFNNIKRIWDKKEVLIITGKTTFDNINFNIFDNVSRINYFNVTFEDSFNNYDNILNNIINTVPKTTLIIPILGPTSTVLSYDIHYAGYRTLDLGHIIKDYDYFMKNIRYTDKDSKNFFQLY